MDDLEADLKVRFHQWKDTLFAYGLIVAGTCIVIYGVVAQ